MKQLFVLLFLLVCSCSLQAQNNQVKIILKSGVVIKGILKELNPAYAKEQERDEAIDNMSNRMSRIEDVLARLESRLGTQI